MGSRVDYTSDVLTVLREAIPGAPVLDVDTELLSSGLLDSMAIVECVAVLEERNHVVFPPQLLVPESFTSARVLAATLERVIRSSTSADHSTGLDVDGS